MNCPSCNNRVLDGTVICPHCDHILDTSFLGSDITNETPPIPSPARQLTLPVATNAGGQPETAVFPDENAHAASAGISRKLDQIAAPSNEAQEAVDELVANFKSMALSQKLTVMGAAAAIASLALPWKNTLDNSDTIGLLAGGWFVGLLAALVLVAMFMRRHPLLRHRRIHLMQGVAATSLLTCIACVSYLKSVREWRVVRSAGLLVREPTAWPDFGVYLALVASLVMLSGAVKSYFDRNALPD